MSANRIVALLTPLVFAPAAGWVTAWAARNAPGLPPLDSTQLTALFITGATVAFGKAALWLHGWQKYEARAAVAPANVQSSLDIAFDAQSALTNGGGVPAANRVSAS
jgi:hypothetical protein